MNLPPFLLYIIDDDEDDLLFIHNAFRDLGLDNVCKGFLSGHDFLQHIKFEQDSEIPDIIILDYDMPRMNGRELFRQLGSIPGYDKVPVVFYSDKISTSTERELMEMGAFCCIKKGVTAKEQISFAQSITGFLKK